VTGTINWQTESLGISNILANLAESNSNHCPAGPKCLHFADAKSHIVHNIGDLYCTDLYLNHE